MNERLRGEVMAPTLSFEATIQQALVDPVVHFAQKLRCALSAPAGQDLLATLQDDYRAERLVASQLRAQASLMPNNRFRDTLNRIAADTEQHMSLLAEQLQALGGVLPATNGQEPVDVPPMSTIWHLITADIAAISAASHRYQRQFGRIAAPPVQRLLQHLRAGKHRHRQQLADLLACTDSYAQVESHR